MEHNRTSAAEVVLSSGERVLFSCRPSAWMFVVGHAGWHAAMAGVLVLGWLAGRSFLADLWGLLLGLWVVAVGARVLWDVLDWFFRRYTLTDRRVVCARGVLRRAVSDLPLERVQYLEVTRSVRQRLVGVGTLAVGTTGLVVPEVVWPYVAHAQGAAAEVRRALEAAGAAGRAASAAGGRVLVVGLAGGIGSGKSTVARLLAERGCVVVDSDALAREILERPEVRVQLAAWWGPGVLTADGRVDRGRVAQIVFADAAERSRLEGLVHPLIRRERDAVIERVRAAGGGIVVVDAPLLFEAGVDRECDVVVWVEAPREARLERVRHRGWDDAELARREAAQMPVEEKRSRSDLIVRNASTLDELASQVAALAAQLLSMPALPGIEPRGAAVGPS